MVKVHVPVPVQSPLQPANVEPVEGVAVSVTELPSAKGAEHVAPQLMPAGLLVTVPVPVPAFETVRVLVVPEPVKVAVTTWSELITTVHVPAPEQPPPLQPAKVEPAEAAAVSVTEVPSLNCAEQVRPQLMPAGLLVTVPAPTFETVRVLVVTELVKVAVTVWSALITTVQVPVPEQPPPLQPAKVEPAEGVAVSTTDVPSAKACEHVDPQSTPAGLLVTVPVPLPAFKMVSLRCTDEPVNENE